MFCNPFSKPRFHYPERLQLLEAKVTKWPLVLNDSLSLDTILKNCILIFSGTFVVGFLFVENFNHSKVEEYDEST